MRCVSLCLCSVCFTGNSLEVLLRKFLVLWQDMSFFTQFSSLQRMFAGSHQYCAFFLLFFFLSVQHQLLAAGSSPSVFLQFVSLSGGWAGPTHPFFLYSDCLQRTLVGRTLCTGNCAKTKPTSRGRRGYWVRVVTQGVYTALFSFLHSTVVLFLFLLQVQCVLVNMCPDFQTLPFLKTFI